MTDLDINKVDTLLQFILVVSGQEDWDRRELGPIHLIKYLFLSDLSYAEHHNGKIFTGIPWKFHHFGPWSAEAFKRIDPALISIGATKKTISHPKYEDDFSRWFIVDENLYEIIDKKIPIEISGAIQRYVHQFGSDTESLLDFVYKTWPMLNAAPSEYLNFSIPEYLEKKTECQVSIDFLKLTDRQLKKKKLIIKEYRAKFRQKLEQRKKEVKTHIKKPPLYDDLFFEGLDTIDKLAGVDVDLNKGTAFFSPEIWKSKARFDPDVS